MKRGERRVECGNAEGDGWKKYRVILAEGKGVYWSEGETFNQRRGMRFQGVEGWVGENIP